MRTAYVTELVAVPQIEDSLFVPRTAAGSVPGGSAISSAGSWTRPPPPTTASIQPAANAAATRKARVARGRSSPARRPLFTADVRSPGADGQALEHLTEGRVPGVPHLLGPPCLERGQLVVPRPPQVGPLRRQHQQPGPSVRGVRHLFDQAPLEQRRDELAGTLLGHPQA